MKQDPREVVRSGYNKLGPRYLEWTSAVDPAHRITYQRLALDFIEPGSLVLELGCGPGLPTGKLAADRHRYVGVDISSAQLAMARDNLTRGHLVCADMSQMAFRPGSFDAVLAFYSIIHVPRDDHGSLLGSIHRWLRPGGVIALNMVSDDNPGDYDEWVDDVLMYWSGFDARSNVNLLRDAGFDILREEILTNFEDNQEVRFLWVLAQKPG